MSEDFPHYVAPSKDRLAGRGATPSEIGEEDVKRLLSQPSPIIEYVRWSMSLPIKEADDLFCDQIYFTVNNRSVRGVDSVDSSFISNAVLQTDILGFGYEVLVDGDPTCFSCTDTRGQVLEWGKPTWDAARALVRGYAFQATVAQRYMLVNDPLADVARVGSRREPVQEGLGSPTSYVDRANAKLEACAACDRPTRSFGPSAINLVPMVSDSKYLDSGSGEPVLFARPVLLEKGMPFSSQLVVSDAGQQAQLRRAVKNEGGAFKGGDLTIEFRLRGFEIWGPWKEYLVAHAKRLNVGLIGRY